MIVVAEVKTPFLHSALGLSDSFTEFAMRRIASRYKNLVYIDRVGVLLAVGELSNEAKDEIRRIKGRTVR